MMDNRSTLHWSALLLALFAASWMLVGIVGPLIVVLPLFALAGFVLLLVHARRLDDDRRGITRIGAGLGLAIYGLWVLFFLLSQPVSIKNVGNSSPPALFADAAETLGTYLPVLGALAVLVAFWALWQTRERILAGVGAATVVLVQLLTFLGVGVGDETLGLVLQLVFALGFLLLAIALVLPLFDPDRSGAAWHGPEAA